MFVSIKEAFGSEVAFTKEFSKNKEYQQSLFDTIGFIYDAEDENLTVVPEDPIPGGRIDDMVYYEGEPKLVIECQDTKGVLDILHATKITAYMYHKGVTDGVVICEDYDQWLVDMVREKFVDRIFIVRPTIFQLDKKSSPLVKFDLVYKPEGFESKARRFAKTTSQSTTSDPDSRIYREYDKIKSTDEDDRYSLWMLTTPQGESLPIIYDCKSTTISRIGQKKATENNVVNYCNSKSFLSKVNFDYTKIKGKLIMSGNNYEEIKNKEKELKS